MDEIAWQAAGIEEEEEEQDQEPAGEHVIRIFYGTDRKRADKDGRPAYSGERAENDGIEL